MGFPLPTNMTGNITYIVQYANTVTDNMFWNIIMVAMMITFTGILMARGAPKEETFVVISIIGLVLSGLMATLQIINGAWMFAFAIMLAISIIILWKKTD